MKNVSKRLTLVYAGIAALVLLLIVLFETEVLESGVMAEDKQSEFLLTFVMELVSLGAAFLAAMMKWGLIRLLIIEVPMLADTLLYYIYMNTTFGYLGIMLLLCMPFVYPSMNRCIAETTEEEK